MRRARLLVAIVPATKIVISAPTSKETALRVFESLPAEGRPPRGGPLPETRAECEHACRPCPWIECRYHLAVDQTAERWGSAVASMALRFDWSKPTCTLDVAEDGPKSVRDVAALMGMQRQGVQRVERRALAKLRALGVSALPRR